MSQRYAVVGTCSLFCSVPSVQVRPVSNVVLLPCRTQLIELNSSLARQALPCYTAVARLGFKRRATAVPNSIHKLQMH